MADKEQWLINLSNRRADISVDGLVRVEDYKRYDLSPDEIAVLEKAEEYGAHSVFFEASRNGRPPVAQAFVFVSDDPENSLTFAELHRRLWSWGGVPLIYRVTKGLIKLFRCAHEPDFQSTTGAPICNPKEILEIAAAINNRNDPWWDASRLRNGTLWDDPQVCEKLLSADKAAHKCLLDEVERLSDELKKKRILNKQLRRRLLILSLLIAYLEDRQVLLPSYFGRFLVGASRFFEVLANKDSLINLLADLERQFNGDVFRLDNADREALIGSNQLVRFAQLIEGEQELGGQRTLWRRYSFKDLPIEFISHIYQLFVTDTHSSVYTPPFLVRLMLDEVLSQDRLNRLVEVDEIILDPCCGSGVFLVEAYKRLVLNWRSHNKWETPSVDVLKKLLERVQGIDLDEGAVELAAFSLCLALCDSLKPETIRNSFKLFPQLIGKTLHRSCFFDAKEQGLIKASIGVVTGNPPFASKLSTPGAERSYNLYRKTQGPLPDKQLAYLFLHEAMEMLSNGGVLSFLQQYSYLYNQKSLDFRRDFISRWDVREVLDFISVRGLFKDRADTKVIVIVAESVTPPENRKILHATFRRSGRVDAEQGFDIDYYDLHWIPRNLALTNDGIWRANLLGGGRVLDFIDRLKKLPKLGDYASKLGWDVGEGFIAAKQGARIEAPHITGQPLLEPKHLKKGASLRELKRVATTHFKSPYSRGRFQSPMVLIHEHEDLTTRSFLTGYYTYKNKIVGLCAPQTQAEKINDVATWLQEFAKPLQAFITAGGNLN